MERQGGQTVRRGGDKLSVASSGQLVLDSFVIIARSFTRTLSGHEGTRNARGCTSILLPFISRTSGGNSRIVLSEALQIVVRRFYRGKNLATVEIRKPSK